jgi:hypothetical protein
MKRPHPIDLIIGFSFGLTSTSEPGKLNYRIAKEIRKSVGTGNDNVFVGVQWEIEDALRRIDPKGWSDYVVEPPGFSEKELEPQKGNKKILNNIKKEVTSNNDLCQILEEISPYEDINRVFDFSDRTASYLNRLLQNTAMFRHFDNQQIKDYKKKKNNKEWIEERTIPELSNPDLSIYQAQRLNRLIIENVIPSCPVAKYIGSNDVANQVLMAIVNRGLNIARILIFGHPAHVERAKNQTIESAWRLKMRMNETQIEVIPCGNPVQDAKENWDDENAQHWIRSWSNWKDHEGL